jgi:hypothetical protein
MPKITQEISKNGKAAFTKKVNSPTDKGRGVMPPPSKAHKKGKGKGSYDRKNAFDEDEESYSGQYKKGETSEAKKKALDNIRKNKKNKTDIKDFKDFTKSKKEGEEDEQTTCWDGYKKKGTKKKGGKTVNNCVKESTNLSKFIEAIMTSNHAQAHKQLKDAINSKIQERIAQEIEKPLF